MLQTAVQIKVLGVASARVLSVERLRSLFPAAFPFRSVIVVSACVAAAERWSRTHDRLVPGALDGPPNRQANRRLWGKRKDDGARPGPSNHAAMGGAAVSGKANPLIAPIPHPNGRARAISHIGVTAMSRKFFVTAPVAMYGFNRQRVRLRRGSVRRLSSSLSTSPGSRATLAEANWERLRRWTQVNSGARRVIGPRYPSASNFAHARAEDGFPAKHHKQRHSFLWHRSSHSAQRRRKIRWTRGNFEAARELALEAIGDTLRGIACMTSCRTGHGRSLWSVTGRFSPMVVCRREGT